MYDLHTHILPSLDDGPSTMEESVQMARQAAADGTRVLVATPHRNDVIRPGSPEDLESRLDQLRERLRADSVELQLARGMESRLLPDLPAAAAEGSALTLNGGRYILVELEYQSYPLYTDQVLYELQLQGLIPVLAHPERQATIQRNVRVLEDLIDRGVLAQVTAGSLAGLFGPMVRRLSRRLLERDMVHLLASDAHTATGPRTAQMRAGVAEATRLVGEERAMELVHDTPRALLEDRQVDVPPPLPEPKRRSWFPPFRR